MPTRTNFDFDEISDRPWEHYLRHNLYIWPIVFLAAYFVVLVVMGAF